MENEVMMQDYFMRYDKDMYELVNSIQKLEEIQVAVKLRVDAAQRNHERIFPRVQGWLQRVDHVIPVKRHYAQKIFERKRKFYPLVRDTLKDAFFYIPYRRETEITRLTDEASSFSRVSYPSQLPQPIVSSSREDLSSISDALKDGVSFVFESSCQRFTFDEIQKATDHFDESKVIGKGGFGKVYKGLVYDGSTASVVAVKRLSPGSKQGFVEFRNEIKTLSRFRHCNLVALEGYCYESQEMILVYEYMLHGTLADHLFKIPDSSLTWTQRLKICIGAARGLDYLHTGTGVSSKVIHRDIKSANILLDENWAAKISDLGLSKIGTADQSCSEVVTGVIKGTKGYMAPEHRESGKISRKTDVYAFGVVLLEVLTGKRAWDGGVIPEHKDLDYWTRQHIQNQTLNKIIDERVISEIYPKCLVTFANIASKSLHNNPKKRPAMSEVVTHLEFALACQEGTNPSSSIVDEELLHHFNGLTTIYESLNT